MFHRRVICLLLAAMLACAPVLAASALSLSALSDQELLALFSSIQKEIERRGLSVETSPAKSISIIPEPMVWVPKSGQKYHSKSTCSNMKNPMQVPLSTAKQGQYEPCKKCKPPN